MHNQDLARMTLHDTEFLVCGMPRSLFRKRWDVLNTWILTRSLTSDFLWSLFLFLGKTCEKAFFLFIGVTPQALEPIHQINHANTKAILRTKPCWSVYRCRKRISIEPTIIHIRVLSFCRSGDRFGLGRVLVTLSATSTWVPYNSYSLTPTKSPKPSV